MGWIDRLKLHLDRKLFRWAVALLLSGAVWLSLAAPAAQAPAFVRAVVVAAVLYLLPGYLLQRLLLPPGEWRGLSLVPISFGLSVAVSVVAWAGARLVGGDLNTQAYLLAALCTALLAGNAVAGQRTKQKEPTTAAGRIWGAAWPYLLVLAPILFWVFVAVGWGALFTSGTDGWYYLAVLRRILDAQTPALGDPFFQGVSDPQRGGPWLASVALLVRLAGLKLVVFWDILPAVMIPVAVLAHYLLADTLFENRLAAGLSCLFLLYGFGRFTWDVPVLVAAPAGAAFTLFLVALALAWRYVRTGNRWLLALAVLAGWAIASIHLLVFAGLLMTLAAFAVVHLAVHRDRAVARRLAGLILLTTLLATPFVRTWLASGTQTVNPIYADEWGVIGRYAGWRILKPSALLGSAPSPWEWAFLLSPALLVLAKRRDWALFLLSTMVLVVGTAFNPLFVEPVLRLRLLPPWGIWRLGLQVFQFQFVLGGLGALAIPWLFRKLRQEWAGPRALHVALLVGCAALAFLPSAVPLAKPMWQDASSSWYLLKHKGDTFPFNWGAAAQFLGHELPAGSVILSDVQTSYFISGLTGHYTVSIPYGHSSPLVNDDEQRRIDTAQALDPNTEMNRVLDILDRYQVEYVLLVLTTPPAGEDSLSPAAYARLVERFQADPLHFRQVFSDEVDPTRRTTIFAYLAQGSAP